MAVCCRMAISHKEVLTMNDKELLREDFIANIRHIGWVAYQIAVHQPYNEKMDKDQFESLIDGIRFQDENPNNTPEQNHENWVKMKTSQGWVHGYVKDFDKKTHPDLVPYCDLPKVEQLKDTVGSIVHRMADQYWKEIQSVG